MCVQGIGVRLCSVELPHLLPHIPRDELDGRLHCRNHTLRFLDTIQTRPAETFLMGNRPNRLDVLLDIVGKCDG
jgi:hypothetical protein